MIRHALAEGWLLLRQRMVVSLILAFALAIPIALAGVTLSLHAWLGPVAGMAGQESVVAVLLHPRLDSDRRRDWVAAEAAAHPDWRISEVSPEDLVQRLERWFPYLGDIVVDGDASLPPLVEISTADPAAVEVLEGRPEVLAVGPRSSLQQLLGRVARRLGAALVGVSVILLAAGVLLAAIWVHLELFRHSDELTIMRLVGATESTIRGPFLVAVAMPGVLAGALSVLGSLGSAVGLSKLTTTMGLPAVVISLDILMIQAAAAVLLPLTVAVLTLARHATDELGD
ncbi:MAG: cell division protein FtsX [Thermoanaerobaculales bacterium]